MKMNIGINDEHLRSVATELNILLADEVLLYIQTRNYHWNVEGSNFNEMHLFFEKQFTELDDIMDGVAERIRMIGHYTEARLSDYLKLTHLVEQPYSNDQMLQLRNLLESQEAVVRNLRRLIILFSDEYKDAGSSDFVTQLLGRHEKMAWMIRAYFD
ncbi:Dps family protein [Lacibacter sediminis]|uniref:DNA starvation/stationary phase protection protein n=1 Tax=Lacibacter sediminis TaxID=2760713 RepID=A0A7G5XKA1_9BACT|nr:DNA starvation/stationary phase protection protein [Lacibacter sediminis]QNA45904.1 DNA starvation/stationary phase protection protein [Lacibacter sediminis]